MFKGEIADVCAIMFQQIIGHQDDRGLSQQFFRHRLAPDPLLQGVEGKRFFVLKRQHFAVDHRAIGQVVAQLRKFGEAVGHQVFAA